MGMKVLVEPYTHAAIAKLYPNQTVEILDDFLSWKLEIYGIEVDYDFRKKYGTRRFVFPAVGQAVFAIAFEHIYCKKVLVNSGYQWKGSEALQVLVTRKLSDEELAQKIIRLHQESVELPKKKTFPPPGMHPDKRYKTEDTCPDAEN